MVSGVPLALAIESEDLGIKGRSFFESDEDKQHKPEATVQAPVVDPELYGPLPPKDDPNSPKYEAPVVKAEPPPPPPPTGLLDPDEEANLMTPPPPSAASTVPGLTTPGKGPKPVAKEEPKLTFKHRNRLVVGGNSTSGLFYFLTGSNLLEEYRVLNSYQQIIRVQESPSEYNYVKLSIDFSKNYDAQSQQWFDNKFIFNEAYHHMRSGAHQFRWGNQLFKLGVIDFGSPVDVLQYKNLFGVITFDPEISKEAITSAMYAHETSSGEFDLYLAPIGNETAGMKLTQMRDDMQARESKKKAKGTSLIRDYIGARYIWHMDNTDIRLGSFHWFDTNPHIEFKYTPATTGTVDLTKAAVDASLALFATYREIETPSDFITLVSDTVLGDMSWKTDMGYFYRRNFYSYYYNPVDRSFSFTTVQAPYFALSTSLERKFSYFFFLLMYSYEHVMNAPINSHLIMYDNLQGLVPYQRDLEQHKGTGVFIWRLGGSTKATLGISASAPYALSSVFGVLNFENEAKKSEYELKLITFQTAEQLQLQRAVSSNQVYFTYIQNF